MWFGKIFKISAENAPFLAKIHVYLNYKRNDPSIEIQKGQKWGLLKNLGVETLTPRSNGTLTFMHLLITGSGPDRVPVKQHDSELQGWSRPTESRGLGTKRLGNNTHYLLSLYVLLGI